MAEGNNNPRNIEFTIISLYDMVEQDEERDANNSSTSVNNPAQPDSSSPAPEQQQQHQVDIATRSSTENNPDPQQQQRNDERGFSATLANFFERQTENAGQLLEPGSQNWEERQSLNTPPVRVPLRHREELALLGNSTSGVVTHPTSAQEPRSVYNGITTPTATSASPENSCSTTPNTSYRVPLGPQEELSLFGHANAISRVVNPSVAEEPRSVSNGTTTSTAISNSLQSSSSTTPNIFYTAPLRPQEELNLFGVATSRGVIPSVAEEPRSVSNGTTTSTATNASPSCSTTTIANPSYTVHHFADHPLPPTPVTPAAPYPVYPTPLRFMPPPIGNPLQQPPGHVSAFASNWHFSQNQVPVPPSNAMWELQSMLPSEDVDGMRSVPMSPPYQLFPQQPVQYQQQSISAFRNLLLHPRQDGLMGYYSSYTRALSVNIPRPLPIFPRQHYEPSLMYPSPCSTPHSMSPLTVAVPSETPPLMPLSPPMSPTHSRSDPIPILSSPDHPMRATPPENTQFPMTFHPPSHDPRQHYLKPRYTPIQNTLIPAYPSISSTSSSRPDTPTPTTSRRKRSNSGAASSVVVHRRKSNKRNIIRRFSTGSDIDSTPSTVATPFSTHGSPPTPSPQPPDPSPSRDNSPRPGTLPPPSSNPQRDNSPRPGNLPPPSFNPQENPADPSSSSSNTVIPKQ